jgi:hypothetical protein
MPQITRLIRRHRQKYTTDTFELVLPCVQELPLRPHSLRQIGNVLAGLDLD